jgi:predicted nucleotidyltransferase
MNGTLEALFPSVRSGVLSATLLQPERWWFMTELARHLEVTPSSLQRELESLVDAGLLLRRQDGRRTYFKADSDSAIFPELRGLMEKTAGIVPSLRAALKRFDKRIDLALIYGSIARGEERTGSDIDVMIVGNVRQIDLVPALRDLEAQFGREVNVVLFSRQEFHRKLAARDHFLHSVLKGKTVLLKGTPVDLENAASRQ